MADSTDKGVGTKEAMNDHEEGLFHSSASETDVEASGYPRDGDYKGNSPQKRLTLTFKDVTVKVTAPDQALGETLWSRVDPRQLKYILRSGDQHKRVGMNTIFVVRLY